MLPEMTPLMAWIAQLKGNMSYAELAKAIYFKTRKRISANALQHIASGARRIPRVKTLQILAEYAGENPFAWFYEPIMAEARAEYLASTGDEEIDELRRQLLSGLERNLHKDARYFEPEDFTILGRMAEEIARARRERKKKKEREEG